MAVLLITYKHDRKTSKAGYEGFQEVIESYRWVKLSESNYAMTADEPAKDVWQKLKAHIDPDDYLVMLTFKSGYVELKRSEGSCLVSGTALEDRALRNHDDPLESTAAGPAMSIRKVENQRLQDRVKSHVPSPSERVLSSDR